MKNKFLKITKKVIACLVASMIVFTAMPFFAESVDAKQLDTENEGYPLAVNVITNKSSYGLFETALYTVNIENVGNSDVTNISAQSDFSELQPVKSDSIIYVDGVTLSPGEKITFSYSVTLKPNKVNFFLSIFLIIKNMFLGVQNIPNFNFDDGRKHTYTKTEVNFGSYSVIDYVNVWYEYDTVFINTENQEDFYAETTELISTTMNSPNFDINQAIEDPYYLGRVIVSSESKLDFSKYNADKVISNDLGISVLQFANGELAENCVMSLSELDSVTYVEPDSIFTLSTVNYDSALASTSSDVLSWGVTYIRSDSYSKYLESTNNFDLMTVAVIDSGVDMDHPFLKGRLLSSGYDWIDIDTIPEDNSGHGTHVAGIIAENTKGLNVKILPYRCFATVKNETTGKYETIGNHINIANAIDKAISSGADVINLSLGGPHSMYLDDAIQKAIDSGVIVCVAAGNGDPVTNISVNTSSTCPAHIEEAIVVGAIDQSGKVAFFSNHGEALDVVAPGVNVYSSYLDGSYASLSGTSMATPHISAVAAMFKLAYPEYTPAQIENLIKDYCVDMGATGRDDYYGCGSVDMYNAIPDCTINFNSNGGSNVAKKTQKSTTEITLPSPTKSYTVTLNANGGNLSQTKYTRYCTLDGWYKSSTFSGLRYAANSTYMAKTDETLYAKWINPKLQNVSEPTRQYYDFAGWYTSASGGAKYTSNNEISQNITLYAHWKPKTAVVPNVIGSNYAQAKSVLESRGLIVNLIPATNSTYAKDIVFAQSIGTNQTVNQGTTITLTYSSGSKPLTVGDYVMFNGGYLYRYVLGDGVYKDVAWGYLTDVYYYNGKTYYQFRYDGASTPFGWAEASYYTQLTN